MTAGSGLRVQKLRLNIRTPQVLTRDNAMMLGDVPEFMLGVRV